MVSEPRMVVAAWGYPSQQLVLVPLRDPEYNRLFDVHCRPIKSPRCRRRDRVDVTHVDQNRLGERTSKEAGRFGCPAITGESSISKAKTPRTWILRTTISPKGGCRYGDV